MMFGMMEWLIVSIVVVAGIVVVVAITFLRNKSESYYVRDMAEPVELDWNAIADAELQSYLPDLKINAIKRYRELTGTGLKEAKEAVEYALAYPERAKKGKSSAGGMVDTDGAGIRDLIAEGRIAEAVDVYAAFMGVDEFTARDAIAQMQQEDEAASRLSEVDLDEVYELVSQNRKIEAIKLYRQLMNVGLKEAKDAVDRME